MFVSGNKNDRDRLNAVNIQMIMKEKMIFTILKGAAQRSKR